MIPKVLKKSGFSLLEVLLSVAIIVSLAGVSAPVFQAYQNKSDLDATVDSVVQNWRRAQTLSLANDGDSNWGVSLQTGSMTIFKGATYATRDTSYDETTTFSPTITISGTLWITNKADVIFDKLTGNPQSTGTVILTTLNNDTKTISINSKGMIDWQ